MEFDAAAPLEKRASQALDFAEGQVRALITAHPDYFPLYTEEGKWQHGKESWTNWCEGFLGGMMWIFARRGADRWWRGQAEHYSRLIEERQHDRNVHDLGFLFWSTWKRWFDLTGDPAINARVVQAGKTKVGTAQVALKRLLAARARVIGALLTQYDAKATGYGYDYESYYSYGSAQPRLGRG